MTIEDLAIQGIAPWAKKRLYRFSVTHRFLQSGDGEAFTLVEGIVVQAKGHVEKARLRGEAIREE